MQKDGPYEGFQNIDFGVKSDIFVGEDGLHLGECVCRQSYSFLYLCFTSGVWSSCEAQVFVLFFPLCKECYIQEYLIVFR